MKNKHKIFILMGILVVIILYSYNRNVPLPNATKVDFIKVYKAERKLCLYVNHTIVKSYTIALGKNPKGAKQYQGDNKTPEGIYTINGKNSNSIAYKNLGISYPNKEDLKRAKKLGKSAGGDIKIHGMLNGVGFVGRFHTFLDWTNGCIAVTDDEMDELYKTIQIGTVIEIVP